MILNYLYLAKNWEKMEGRAVVAKEVIAEEIHEDIPKKKVIDLIQEGNY